MAQARGYRVACSHLLCGDLPRLDILEVSTNQLLYDLNKCRLRRVCVEANQVALIPAEIGFTVCEVDVLEVGIVSINDFVAVLTNHCLSDVLA